MRTATPEAPESSELGRVHSKDTAWGSGAKYKVRDEVTLWRTLKLSVGDLEEYIVSIKDRWVVDEERIRPYLGGKVDRLVGRIDRHSAAVSHVHERQARREERMLIDTARGGIIKHLVRDREWREAAVPVEKPIHRTDGSMGRTAVPTSAAVAGLNTVAVP